MDYPLGSQCNDIDLSNNVFSLTFLFFFYYAAKHWKGVRSLDYILHH